MYVCMCAHVCITFTISRIVKDIKHQHHYSTITAIISIIITTLRSSRLSHPPSQNHHNFLALSLSLHPCLSSCIYVSLCICLNHHHHHTIHTHNYLMVTIWSNILMLIFYLINVWCGSFIWSNILPHCNCFAFSFCLSKIWYSFAKS